MGEHPIETREGSLLDPSMKCQGKINWKDESRHEAKCSWDLKIPSRHREGDSQISAQGFDLKLLSGEADVQSLEAEDRAKAAVFLVARK